MIRKLRGIARTVDLKVKNEPVMDLEIHWCDTHRVADQLTAMGDELSFKDCQCVLMVLDLQKADSRFINSNLRRYGISLADFTASLDKLKRNGLLGYEYTQTSARHVKGWILA